VVVVVVRHKEHKKNGGGNGKRTAGAKVGMTVGLVTPTVRHKERDEQDARSVGLVVGHTGGWGYRLGVGGSLFQVRT
jgi:hypothetical protein